MRIHIDHTRREPLNEQIYRSLRGAILESELLPGSKLPSSRSLARRLKVSRNTVLSAYDALSAEGLVAGRTGSATRVCERPARAASFFVPRLPDPRVLLAEAQYPAGPAAFQDLEGNPLYIQR